MTKMRFKGVAVLCALVPVCAFAQLTPTLAADECSFSGQTSITSGFVPHVRPGSGALTTFTVTTPQLAPCGSNTFDKAAVVLSGFKWHMLANPTRLCDFELDIKNATYNSATRTVTFDLTTGVNTTGCSAEDEPEFDVWFDIWRSTSGTSGSSVAKHTCTSSKYDNCDASATHTGVVIPPERFMGAAMTGFRLHSLSATGTDIEQLRAGITSQSVNVVNPNTDVDIATTCGMGLDSATGTGIGIDCDVSFAILTASAAEFVSNPSYRHFDHSKAASLTNSILQTAPSASPATAGLENFYLWLHTSLGTPAPVWGAWAGFDSMSSGTIPGPFYQETEMAYLDDSPHSTPPPYLLTGGSKFDYDFTVKAILLYK